MEIAFHTKELRAICEDIAIARNKYGTNVASLLTRRMADLQSANVISELLAGNPTFCDDCHMTINIAEGYKFFIKKNHSKKKTDWNTTSRIQIIEIKYYE